MHERDARAKDEGVRIPGVEVLPANAVRKLEIRTGLNNTICTALLKRTTGERGK